MYPYLHLFWLNIPFQGLGIVLATIVFIYWIYRYSKKVNLRFSYFFNYLGLFIISWYLFWKYFYNLISYHIFLPTDLGMLISPYNYKFSFIWISFWVLLVLFLFLSKLEYLQERKKWFDVFFYSLSLALIILGPFLLLWDVFFWVVTHSSFWVHALTTDTSIPYPTASFYPVWIFVSFLGLILYVFWKLFHFIFKKSGLTLFLFPFLFLGFAFIFHFQYYPKHFLFWIDIKILYCYLIAIFWTWIFYTLLNYKKW